MHYIWSASRYVWIKQQNQFRFDKTTEKTDKKKKDRYNQCSTHW